MGLGRTNSRVQPDFGSTRSLTSKINTKQRIRNVAAGSPLPQQTIPGCAPPKLPHRFPPCAPLRPDRGRGGLAAAPRALPPHRAGPRDAAGAGRLPWRGGCEGPPLPHRLVCSPKHHTAPTQPNGSPTFIHVGLGRGGGGVKGDGASPPATAAAFPQPPHSTAAPPRQRSAPPPAPPTPAAPRTRCAAAAAARRTGLVQSFFLKDPGGSGPTHPGGGGLGTHFGGVNFKGQNLWIFFRCSHQKKRKTPPGKYRLGPNPGRVPQE